MKKLFTILLLCTSLVILSSCVVVADADHFHHTADLTFVNDTSYFIEDWFAEDRSGENYNKSEKWVPVPPNKSSTIYDLHYRDYRIRFTYDCNSHPYYYATNYTYINEDTTFYLSDESFYSRSVNSTENESTEPKLVLTDNNGNIIPLELVD